MNYVDPEDARPMTDDEVDRFISEFKSAFRKYRPKVGDVFVLTVPAELFLAITQQIQVIADTVVVSDNIKVEFVPAAQAKR